MHSSINSKDNMKLKKLFFTLALMLGCITASAQTDSTFYIKGPMGRLAARLQLPALQQGEKCPMVILCHGFTANMQGPLFDTISDKLTEAGIGVVRFDFNGHGASEGDFINMTVPNEIDDALAVIAFTRNLPQTASISLLGHSQGGVVSAMTAGRLGKYAIRSVVLMAPAAVLRDDACGATQWESYTTPGTPLNTSPCPQDTNWEETTSRPPSNCRYMKRQAGTTALYL